MKARKKSSPLSDAIFDLRSNRPPALYSFVAGLLLLTPTVCKQQQDLSKVKAVPSASAPPRVKRQREKSEPQQTPSPKLGGGSGYLAPTDALQPGYRERYQLPELELCIKQIYSKKPQEMTLTECMRKSMGEAIELTAIIPIQVSMDLPWQALRYDRKLSRCAKYHLSPSRTIGYPTIVIEAKVGVLKNEGQPYFAIPLAKGNHTMLVSFSKTQTTSDAFMKKVWRSMAQAQKTLLSIPYGRFQLDRDKTLANLINPQSTPWIFYLYNGGVTISEPPPRELGEMLTQEDEAFVEKGVLIDRPFSFSIWSRSTNRRIASGFFHGNVESSCRSHWAAE